MSDGEQNGFYFELIHSVVDEYFHKHVGRKREFTQHLGRVNEKNMEAVFYLYYDSGDVVDVQREMRKMTGILFSLDEQKACKRCTLFKMGTA